MSEMSKDQISKSTNLEGKETQSSDYVEDYEIDLYDLLLVLWNQKLIIFGVMLVSLVAGFVYILLASPLYEITMQVRPPMVGPYKGWSTEDIRRWIEEDQYFNLLGELPAKPEQIKIRASVQRGSSIVKWTLLYPDPTEGKQILNSVYEKAYQFYILKNGDTSAAQVKSNLEKEIQDLETELSSIDLVELPNLEVMITRKIEQQKVLEKIIDVANQQKEVYSLASSALSDLLNKVSGSYTQVIKSINRMVSSKLDKISALILQQIAAQSAGYEGDLITQITLFKARILELDEQISNLQKELIQSQQEIDQLKYQKEQLNLKKEKLSRQIAQKKFELQHLTVFEKVSEPIASFEPVRPKKLLILAVSGVLGMFSGILLAFLRHGWQKRFNS
ncbi:Wzz/FepE/Etk N-terminal domain-containing protein [Thermodesulforhabdus norvegica]|uniref:Chain length determinant protein n=1 Tax=Thermodesulforhabdus norvegica TaxID=39841 RepID=A0A1I4TX06_9BACT|nr:Wzz/FepE/Etk N-terminal domain-containing protein [Thermodesulforhabdus norvegica]SFM81130.1 Chain length determinant protein [Thermodesulforhabdus norvegica]